MDEQTLCTLLRLKRLEQPPPGYYEAFLKEFQQRQRAELLRRPLWSILLERLAQRLAWLFTRPVTALQSALRQEAEVWSAWRALSRLSYATASLFILAIAGALTYTMVQNPGSGVRTSVAALASGSANLLAGGFPGGGTADLAALDSSLSQPGQFALSTPLTAPVRIPEEFLSTVGASFTTPVLNNGAPAFNGSSNFAPNFAPGLPLLPAGSGDLRGQPTLEEPSRPGLHDAAQPLFNF